MLLKLLVLVSVSLSLPSELETDCAPYLQKCAEETDLEPYGDIYACNTIYEAANSECTITSNTIDDYWVCFRDAIDDMVFLDVPARVRMSKKTKFLEACIYEESKDLLTYSFYVSSEWYNFTDKRPTVGLPGMEETQYIFGSDVGLAIGDVYACTIEFVFNEPGNEVNVVILPSKVKGMVYTDQVIHTNIHACLLSANQTTCSVKFPQDTHSGSACNQQTFVERGNDGDVLELELPFPKAGEWLVMGHIQYFIETDGGEYQQWDIGMTKKVVVAEEHDPTDGGSIVLSIFAIWLGLIYHL